MNYTDAELDTIATVRDMRRVGGCVDGQMRWFKQHGMDWREIVRDGVRLRDIHDKNDGEGNQIVARVIAKIREGSHG